MEKKCDIGLIGLAVMGENLVLNMESHGFQVAVFNRTTSKVDAFMNGRAKGKNIVGCHSIEELVANLERPARYSCWSKQARRWMLLSNPSSRIWSRATSSSMAATSHFPDTIRRTAYVESKGLLYIGTGVSGGEEGALKGPSHHARRFRCSMAACQGNFPVHLGQG